MNSRKMLAWVTIYSVAMGFLEAAVVIYLRQLAYPDGFKFPIIPLHHNLAAVELWREVATIVMLLAIGAIAGKNRAERLAYFIFSFAVWDIFYYVFLYVFMGWPQSLLTWDILFLIPVPWVGPVLSPVIIAATMILFAITIIRLSGKGYNALLAGREKWLLFAGSMVAIVSFTEDYVRQNGTLLYFNLGRGGSFLSELCSYVPVKFDWPVFTIGEALLLLAYALYVRRVANSPTKRKATAST